MSYRPIEHDLKDPIRQILDGISLFCEAVASRIASDAYKKAHLLELHETRSKLLDMQIDLNALMRDS